MTGKTQTEQVMTAEQFVDALAVNGLLSDSDLDLVRESWLSETKSAEELARRLVGDGRLTAFQARRVYAGKAHVLVLGNYVVQEKIGAGGMGEVYKATHRVMKREVAVKVLPSKLVNNAMAVQRFHREVQAAARLSHVNIVTAHDAAEFRGVHYLVMECVEGRDLAALVRANGPLPVDQAVSCVLQTAQGLDYAHQNGIVHRDIKPHNLLLDVSGTIKILDMGLAQFTETDAGEVGLTATGIVMGTADYMSPEQAVDTKTVDARSDIYSLGATLFYLLAGRAMYAGETMISRILAHRDQPVPDLIEANASVPPALNAIYQKMVAKSVAERYQSMSEVIAELERCQVADSAQTTLRMVNDPELHRFLQNRELDAEMSHHGEPASAPTMSETSVSTSPLEATFTSSTRRSRSHRAGPQGTVLAVAAVGVLGLVALLAGIFLRIDTPAGTIVLEIDQPEAIGAVVTVDGVKKITIKSDGEEPIEISADEKQHTLKVTKGGFETFTQEFSIGKGEKKNIRVALEKKQPVNAVIASDPIRTVAEMVLRGGGELKIIESGGTRMSMVKEVDQLPDGRFAIEVIQLQDTERVSDAEWKGLGNIPYLKAIRFMPGSNARESMHRLRRLAGCVSLDSNSVPLTGGEIEQLSQWKDLNDLLLFGSTDVTDAACDSLIKLTQLRTLNVVGTSITGVGLKKLAGLPNLNWLTLGVSDGIQAKDLSELALHQSLRKLHLWTGVTDDAIEYVA